MHILLKTIIVLLIVMLRAGAEGAGIALPKELSDAMNPELLDIPIEERPALYLELSEDEKYSS